MPTITYQTYDGRTVTVDAKYKGVAGYAGYPGSGPQGETCGSCNYFLTLHYHGKTYFKCDATEWTHGAATDIRKRSPACSYWAAVSVGTPDNAVSK
jgi:hypothetical protein